MADRLCRAALRHGYMVTGHCGCQVHVSAQALHYSACCLTPPHPLGPDRRTHSVPALAHPAADALPLTPAGTGYIRCEDLRRIVHNLGRSLAYRSVKELVATVAEGLAATTSGGSRHKADRVYYRQLLPEHVKHDKVGMHCSHVPLTVMRAPPPAAWGPCAGDSRLAATAGTSSDLWLTQGAFSGMCASKE